jgi:hypothetical protein
MNERRSAGAESEASLEDRRTAAESASKSGVVRVPTTKRPSWEVVDEYLRAGKHRDRVEGYAFRDPAFAEVLRWMRNDREDSGLFDDGAPPAEERATRPLRTCVI